VDGADDFRKQSQETITVQARIPVSTYRLQFNRDFTFGQARSLVDYFDELGVTDLYSSPVLKARPGSVHGYDVVDPTRLNPEVGAEEEFAALARELRGRGMGLLMDVVPNHMCIAGSENRWWLDVLENGPSSPFARFFDIDWNPPNPNLKNRVLLPILGDQFGRVLENQEVRVTYRDGAFHANYWETSLPVAPRTSTLVLELALEHLRGADGGRPAQAEPRADVLELESIITSLRNLPPRTETDPARVRERLREKAVARRRLSALVRESNEARAAVHAALDRLNGQKGDPRSFDQLAQLISDQAYRLSFWRAASDEINYRRFFDINELAAVRVEERPVFTAVHEVVFRLMRQGFVTGLRVDHVDGLHDPYKYLTDLQRDARTALRRAPSGAGEADGDGVRDGGGDAAGGRPCYVVVEKILGHDEQLRRDWPVHGTTGYEYLNLLNGVFVEGENGGAFRELYEEFTGRRVRFEGLLYQCKRLILRHAMSSELHVLARRLDRIKDQSRHTRDFTLNSLQEALAEVIACFPVYRTYVRRSHDSISVDDRLHINAAVRAAKRRNRAQDTSIFDFVGSVLLLEDPKGLTREQRAERRDFVLRFQQLTSPVTAKGLEDTAFYRFYPLSSLNEVGGEPAIFGTPTARFHERNEDRREAWPHTLSTTSTHDTKRGEDVRARLNVLSEIPEEWNRAIHRWRELNRPHKSRVEGVEAPDANEEYLFYQTLVGTWPFEAGDDETHEVYVGRIQGYMLKAVKEAKLHTSWINPNEEYERAVTDFVGSVLDRVRSAEFLADLEAFQRVTARAGMLNSLSQTLLKIASPGVPDFFQGTEVWDFSLVDPDNRRPVDYDLRRRLLSTFRAGEGEDRPALVAELLARPHDGRVKLYVTSRALNFRRRNAQLFAAGEYVPLEVAGRRARCAVAFARRHGGREALVVAGRFFTRLGAGVDGPLRLAPEAWGDTALRLGETVAGARFRDVFTGREFAARAGDGWGELPLAELLSPLPVALLERVDG
jgi:(1->4)-alpha-D-glucan 1-alpha-D-glucosylmutase